MKFIPAIDLKEGKCVRLYEGKQESSVVYNEDPVKQAKFFESQGCERIHIVDLDAAFGHYKINRETIVNIRKSVKVPIELGGGIRNKDDIIFWFNNNIEYLIIGSLAVKDIELVLEVAKKFDNRIYVSLDILNNKLMIKGWIEKSQLSLKYIYDIDGIKRIDFFGNNSSLPFGHANANIFKKVNEQISKGVSFNAPHESHIELAQILCERIKSIESVRFTNSGTEATMNCIHAARAFTGKSKIVKVDGAYHGIYDAVAYNTPGSISDGKNKYPLTYL